MAAGYQVPDHDVCQAWTQLADHELMFHDLDDGLTVLDVATGARSVILSSNRIVSTVFSCFAVFLFAEAVQCGAVQIVWGQAVCTLGEWQETGQTVTHLQQSFFIEFQDQDFHLTNYTFEYVMICRLIDFPSSQILQLSAWAMGKIICWLSWIFNLFCYCRSAWNIADLTGEQIAGQWPELPGCKILSIFK